MDYTGKESFQRIGNAFISSCVPKTGSEIIRDKNIRIPCAAVVAVTAEDDLPAVGAEHGKRIKRFVVADFLRTGAVRFQDVHIKWKATLVFVVAAKDHVATG
jgi:hypothetical protein